MNLSYLGVAPELCCDRKQIDAIRKFKYILDNLIGRCPACYYNFVRFFCEMACSPDHDNFLWPIETGNMSRPTTQEVSVKPEDTEGIRDEWALPDYVDPEAEGEEKEQAEVVSKPVEMVEVVTKIRYYLSYKQAHDFINSCW